MKRERLWKLWIVIFMIAILAMQVPVLAQGGKIIYLPLLLGTWKGYVPFIRNDPPATATPTAIPIATNTPLPPGVPPAYSTSFYMETVNGTSLYNLGCQMGVVDRNLAGARDTILILDFGSPKLINSEYGTDLTGYGPVTITQIKAAAENFGRGYYVCAATDPDSQIYMGIGTTNFGSVLASSTATARAHGAAWAQMVNDVNSWLITNGFSGQVHAVGADDIEPAWSSPLISRAWVDGYGSVSKYDYYDFGSADGCSPTSTTQTTCGNGWTREDVWYKAYGTLPGFPMPEIYNNTGYNAKQWAILSLYSVSAHGYKIDFRGLMTQNQACQQAGMSQCSGVSNTPSAAWLQLYNELNKNASTRESPKWLTDIKWGTTIIAAPAASGVAPTPGPPQPSNPQQIVNSYPQVLAQKGLDAQMRASLQEKLRDAERLLSDKASGDAHPASKDPAQAPAAPVVGDTGFQLGIFDGPASAVHSWEGSVINHWQGTVGSSYVIVSAGATADDPSQGMLIVTSVSGDRTAFNRQVFLTPQKAGAVQITASDGTTLTLTAANGTQFTFDASTDSFIK